MQPRKAGYVLRAWVEYNPLQAWKSIYIDRLYTEFPLLSDQHYMLWWPVRALRVGRSGRQPPSNLIIKTLLI